MAELRPASEWRIVLSLDDGTDTNVVVVPVMRHFGPCGEEPALIEASSAALAMFVRSVADPNERVALQERWEQAGG